MNDYNIGIDEKINRIVSSTATTTAQTQRLLPEIFGDKEKQK